MDCDGNITLNEISLFTGHETRRLAKKENTYLQKPVYRPDLEQSGTIVVTDINKTNSRLIFKEKIQGNIIITDIPRNLTLELSKNPGTKRQIGLSPGHYQVKIHYRGNIYTNELKIKEKKSILLHLLIL